MDKPVYTDALHRWVGHVPPDIISDINNIAPMLAILGYNPHANPPEYASYYKQLGPTLKSSKIYMGDYKSNAFNQQNNVNPY